MSRVVRLAAGLAMSVALTSCVGYVETGPEPVYVSSGYYYGNYYEGGYYYRRYNRRFYGGRRYYYDPAPSPAPAPAQPAGVVVVRPPVVVAPVVILPGRGRRRWRR